MVQMSGLLDKKYLFLGVFIALSSVLGGMVFFSGQKPIGILTYVNGHSMEPTLPNGTKICLFRNFPVVSGDIKTGDIVGIHFNGKNINMVKRVIGIPGDQIVFGKDGYIYRNGEQMKEDYIIGNPKFFLTPGFSRVLLQIERFGGILPSNMFLVLGDNRRNSLDSSEYGLIHFDQILGTVEVKNAGNCGE
ncbi:MAG: signal peptidase I [Candidatus Gracilibacteria bacterium]|nr:signal peptidase I [Candidatus Gracilibacteria bacterium]